MDQFRQEEEEERQKIKDHGSHDLMMMMSLIDVIYCFYCLIELLQNIQQTFMGNQSRSQKRLGPQTLLNYYSLIHHHTHRTIPIYTSKMLPMTFIMKLQRNIQRSRLFHIYQQVTNQDSPFLIHLYGFKMERKTNCYLCTDNEGGQDRTVQFWEYLNYSLSQHIQHRIKRKARFTQHQIWHVLQVIFEGLNVLAQYGLLWHVNSKHLLITPEGKVKCQWSMSDLNISQFQYHKTINQNNALYHHTQQPKKPISHRQVFSSQIDITQVQEFMSPEQEWNLKQGERGTKINGQKCNVYKIGLLILYLLTLEVPNSFNIGDLLMKIKSEAQDKVYLQLFVKVLPSCLKKYPQERCSLSQLQKSCRPFFNDEYELLINDSKRQDIQEYNMQAQFKLQKNQLKNYPTPNQTHQKRSIIQDTRMSHLHLRDNKTKRQQNTTLIDKNSIFKPQVFNKMDQRLIELREYRQSMLKYPQKIQ